jgi:hypothetical protein
MRAPAWTVKLAIGLWVAAVLVSIAVPAFAQRFDHVTCAQFADMAAGARATAIEKVSVEGGQRILRVWYTFTPAGQRMLDRIFARAYRDQRAAEEFGVAFYEACTRNELDVFLGPEANL